MDVTQQPYDAFMYENVLKPIGMVNSFYTQPAPEARRAQCASGYHADGSQVPNKFHAYPEQAAAGLWMTPTDLCQYIIETQLAYAGKSAKVLNQEMTKLRLTPYNDASSALGVFIENRNGSIYFQHSAGNEGFCGQYFGSLESGDGVAVFLNTDSYGLLPEIVNSVATVYNWKGFYDPQYKTTIKVPNKIQQKYVGVYSVGDRFTNIVRRKDGYYLYAQGTYAKMHFTSKTDFFNLEFPTDKNFISNASGEISGYERTDGGVILAPAIKVSNPDTVHGTPDFFNELGWTLLENKYFKEAIQYLNRGLTLHPESLYISGNLAHAYLFDGNYQKALEIYAAHKGAYLRPGILWEDMINEDFTYLKQAGLDAKKMESIYSDLNMKVPEQFKSR
jgi:tetratricopeptide (TPR) repeat protein